MNNSKSNLKELFKEIWPSIETEYNAGGFCSERHMQAEIYFQLKQSKNIKDYKFWIEPVIYSNDKLFHKLGLKGIIPDMLVSIGTSIVGVVEIKYVPHGYSQFNKDMTNIKKFYTNKGKPESFQLKTDNITGQYNNDKFTIDNDILLIYLVIANAGSDSFSEKESIWKSINADDYLFLTGRIDNQNMPVFK